MSRQSGGRSMTKTPSQRKTWLPYKKGKRPASGANLSAWKILKRNAVCELSLRSDPPPHRGKNDLGSVPVGGFSGGSESFKHLYLKSLILYFNNISMVKA